MISFSVDSGKCTRCGECVADCASWIIRMKDGVPAIPPEEEENCIRCQHCLTICPTGAVSILGLEPGKSLPLPGNTPSADQVETLIRGRRSVRRFQEENVEPAILQRILDVAAHYASARNDRPVRFSVVDDRKVLARLREDLMAGLGRKMRQGGFPQGLEFFAEFVELWEKDKTDILFRGAPHFLVASTPKTSMTGTVDCFIALSCFDLFAPTLGVGTLWDGLAKIAINDILPEFRSRFGVPDDHVFGYSMAFGMTAVRYARTAQHAPAPVHRVS